jgi:hypothetical protein
MDAKQHALLIVERLNEIAQCDANAMRVLCETRVPCNETLRNHHTVQVLVDRNGEHPTVGLLGILNGIVGIADNGWGYIAGIFDLKTRELLRFKVLDPASMGGAVELESSTQQTSPSR